MKPTSQQHLNTSELPDSGECTIGTTAIYWQQRAYGEVVFSSDGSQYRSLDAFLDTLPENALAQGRDKSWAQLQIVNSLLAHHRPYAQPDNNGYYASSVGITTSGRLFLSNNNEHAIKDSFDGRGCAESSMLADAQRKTGDTEVDFRTIYLMSGMATKQEATVAGEKMTLLRDRTPGQLSCLCGECRKNLRAHTSEAEFIMVPTNDGNRLIEMQDAPQVNAGTSGNWVKPLLARRLTYEEMYPLPPSRVLNEEQSAYVREGYLAITEPKQPVAEMKTTLPHDVDELAQDDWHRVRDGYVRAGKSIHALNDHPTLANINTALVQLIQKAYRKHAPDGQIPAAEITAVFVQTYDGEFFPSVLVAGREWLSSKPQEMATALSNGYNQRGIKEVYMMTFNNHQLQQERAEAFEGLPGLHEMKMPDPAGLGRLIKNMRKADNPPLHVIPLNDGTLDDAAVAKLIGEPLDVRRDFGPAFDFPKQSLAVAQQAGPAGASR